MSLKMEDRELRKMQAISKILIANRGEIARRVIRTAKGMGIATVAIYADEEVNALFVKEATEACSLGNGDLASTYLNVDLIISLAKRYGCDAIHPGYGFLSENAEFAKACKGAGITFIGPEPEAISLMGNKNEARNYVQSLGIPLPPSIKAGSFGEVVAQVLQLKYPLMIKAVAGGGGKGMKIVYSADELQQAWESAQREALAYFGNGELYLEQYIENARHIEVQILGDHHGNVVHLYERECSIQRRHQKIIEEAPSPTLADAVREKLLSTAVHIAKSMHYTGAGTLEFLFDQDMNFYFLEMNTRIQVEHPVTEAITGVDIVKEQIRIAEGKTISFQQEDIRMNGHAIECRVYAEDPFTGFLPSAGEMVVNLLPGHNSIRIDTAYDGAATVSSSFDPMIAKITTHAPERKIAIAQLHQYLKNCAIQGIKTNLEYLNLILADEDFGTNNISTGYCAQKSHELNEAYLNLKEQTATEKLIAAILAKEFLSKPEAGNIWEKLGSWRFPGKRAYKAGERTFETDYQILGNGRISFSVNRQTYKIENVINQEPVLSFLLNNERQSFVVSEVNHGGYFVSVLGLTFQLQRADLPDLSVFNGSGKEAFKLNGDHVFSPLNGKVIKLNVKKGDKVKKGELLLIIESMKMENNILSPLEAVVADVMVVHGAQVAGKDLLVKLTMAN